MGLFEGCLLASDIDGTLLVNGVVSGRSVDRIRYFISEGGAFSIATGRSVGAVNMILREIPDVSMSIVANGCMIYDYAARKTVYELTLPREDYGVVRDVMALGCDIGIEVHSNGRVLILNSNGETADHERYEEIEGEQVSFEEAVRYTWNKVVFFPRHEEDSEALKRLTASKGGGSRYIDTTTMFYGRTRHYHEQIPPDISKATALKKLCELLDIKEGRCYAIGDYYNDLEMIRAADIGAAPCDSPEDITQQADFVTGPAADGAVADFIDYLTKVRKEAENGR